MTLNDNAVFKLSTGHFYLAPVGTAEPTDLSNLDASWVEIGHTSLDNVLSQSSDGGDTTTLGTLQASSLRTSTTPIVVSWAFNLQQFDVDSLKLYFGSNSTPNTPDTDEQAWLRIASDPQPTTKAFLIVLFDGETKMGIHCQKAEIARGDDMDFSDTSSLSSLPLKVTPLDNAGAPARMSITPLQAA